jgi:hypothetical protein
MRTDGIRPSTTVGSVSAGSWGTPVWVPETATQGRLYDDILGFLGPNSY